MNVRTARLLPWSAAALVAAAGALTLSLRDQPKQPHAEPAPRDPQLAIVRQCLDRLAAVEARLKLAAAHTGGAGAQAARPFDWAACVDDPRFAASVDARARARDADGAAQPLAGAAAEAGDPDAARP